MSQVDEVLENYIAEIKQKGRRVAWVYRPIRIAHDARRL